MESHIGNNLEHERLEIALARALADGAVVRFAAPASLIAALPSDLRVPVSRALNAYQPFVDGLGAFWGHLRFDRVPDGSWGIAKCCGAHAGYWFVIACNEIRYREAIAYLQHRLVRQRASISLN